MAELAGFDHADVTDWWEVLSRCHEHPSWDDWYQSVFLGAQEFWVERDDMPCPECGTRMEDWYGQIGQDQMGNSIDATGFVCHGCGYDQLEVVQ